jgi:hypothetical protein
VAATVGAVATRVREAAEQPVSAASVAAFRVAFGVGMVLNAALYFPDHVREYYVEPTVHFPYEPLTFVVPLPGVGMYLEYVVMAVTGALLVVGLWSRVAAGASCVLTTYVFLLDSFFRGAGTSGDEDETHRVRRPFPRGPGCDGWHIR